MISRVKARKVRMEPEDGKLKSSLGVSKNLGSKYKSGHNKGISELQTNRFSGQFNHVASDFIGKIANSTTENLIIIFSWSCGVCQSHEWIGPGVLGLCATTSRWSVPISSTSVVLTNLMIVLLPRSSLYSVACHLNIWSIYFLEHWILKGKRTKKNSAS